MHRPSSTKRILFILGSGLALSACDTADTPILPPTYLWTSVSNDMRIYCATSTACHAKGTTQPFSYDLSEIAGMDVDNYNLALSPALVTPADPASSPIIVIGKGGTYQGMTHRASLPNTVVNLWINWVAAGAIYP